MSRDPHDETTVIRNDKEAQVKEAVLWRSYEVVIGLRLFPFFFFFSSLGIHQIMQSLHDKRSLSNGKGDQFFRLFRAHGGTLYTQASHQSC